MKFLIPVQKPYKPFQEEQGEKLKLNSENTDTDDGENVKSIIDYCTNWPPPFFIVLITVFQIVYFIADQSNVYLMYDPKKRNEFWRFLTYMFVHIK